jgi:hypothetical protein
MLGHNSAIYQQINNYYAEKVQARKLEIQKTIHVIAKVVQEILRDVESQEPRFISTLVENNGRFEGLQVHSHYEFEVILYLNQMGVFNFVDDGSIQGCAVLKLSDGRKRSMSLWVEFITASGYLSARKIRSRFQTLVAQTAEKPQFRDKCKLIADSSDVRLSVYDKYFVQITCAFKCSGIWPRSASHWPNNQIGWPNPETVKEVRCEGFDLLSREVYTNAHQTQPNKQPGSTMEGDAWAMSMAQAEEILLNHVNRRKVLSILKTLRDRHLDYPGSPITNYIVKTLILYECEKHTGDHEWSEYCIADRVVGVLLQLVSCLQCRRCPHYFLPQLDLFKGKPVQLFDNAAKISWSLVRQLLLSARSLETL